MIALKVEMIGDQIAVILNEEALGLLNAQVGGTLHLEPMRDGTVLAAVTQEVWVEDPHARGRAFLKRYNRTFEQLS
jgi:ATP-dependent exoDNAse (exonuclease V) alpha subunit